MTQAPHTAGALIAAACLQVVNGFNSTVFAYGQTSSGKVRFAQLVLAIIGVVAMLPCS